MNRFRKLGFIHYDGGGLVEQFVVERDSTRSTADQAVSLRRIRWSHGYLPEPASSEIFIAHLLARTIRVEESLTFRHSDDPRGSSGYTPFRLADVSWTLRISPWCTVAT